MKLHWLNPARNLTTRLILGLWITILVTAFAAGWLGKALDKVVVESPSGKELKALYGMANHLMRLPRDADPKSISVGRLLKRPKKHRGPPAPPGWLLYDKVSQDYAGAPKTPIEMSVRRIDLATLANHANPIRYSKGPGTFIGPVQLDIPGREISLFMVRVNENGSDPRMYLGWIVFAAVLSSMLFCYLFVRSIVKPIHHLQASTRQLAQGDWGARANLRAFRHDEVGDLAEDFNGMATRLETMWEAQKRLLGDISHELRSPLTRLQMGLGIAYQTGTDEKVLQRIEIEAERMETLIGRLLQLNRAQTGYAELIPLLLPDVMLDLIADAQFEAKQHGKSVICDSFPTLHFNADHELLRSALDNLIRNAIKYANSEVKVEIEHDNNTLVIRVVDDGPGVAENELARIFTPFYRTAQARDRTSGGVGLGLAIAKAVIELHHGAIYATKNKGDGLTVSVELPLHG